jgi:hypothetical protein
VQHDPAHPCNQSSTPPTHPRTHTQRGVAGWLTQGSVAVSAGPKKPLSGYMFFSNDDATKERVFAEWEAAAEQRIAAAAAETAKNAEDPEKANLPPVEPDHKFSMGQQGKAKGAIWKAMTDEEKKVRLW